MKLDADLARRLLAYDPETGLLRWRERRRPCISAGQVAGCVNPSGYVTVVIAGSSYKAHRVAWLMTHGEWPTHHIDHINGNCSDNRLANLRSATRSQNLSNSRVRKDSTTGRKGVSFHRQVGKWVAYVNHQGKRFYLGLFDSPEAAALARDTKARELHGEFARCGGNR